MRLRQLLLAPVALVAACLPSRDNPQDPAHRPVPLLLVRDVSRSNGSCPCSFDGAQVTCDADSLDGSTTAASSRGRCLALDARSSTDPDEGEPELDFRFFVHASGGEIELTSPVNGLVATNGLFLLGAPLRSQLPTDTEVTFVVRAEDKEGNHARDDAGLTLLSSRPQLRAPSARTFPLGGLPWLLDEPGGAPDYTVDFRATGLVDEEDPSDLDHLVYCWTIGTSAEVCHRDAAHADFTRVLDADVEQVVPAFLRVSDWAGPEEEAVDHPETFSNTVRTRVAIGARPLWLRDFDGTYGLERIDPIHSSLSTGGMTAVQSSDVILAASFGDRLAYALTGPTFGITLFDDSGAPAPPTFSMPMTSEIIELAADIQRDRVWFAYEESFPADEPLCAPATTDPHITLRAFDGDLVEQVCVHLPLYGQKPRPSQFTIDSTGAVWVADRFGATLHRVSPATGATSSEIISAGAGAGIILDVTARPDSDEVWVLVRSEPFDSPFPADMVALVYDATTQSLVETYDLQTEDTVFGPWWVDRDRFWTFTESFGMRLVDARLLGDDLGIVDATVSAAVIAGNIDANAMECELPDPATGGIWARMAGTPQDRAVFVSPEGEASYFDIDRFHPQFVDDAGALWQTNERLDFAIPAFLLERGFVPGTRGVVTTIPALSRGAQPDIAGGGVWTAGLLTPAIRQFAENGAPLRLLQTFRDLDSNTQNAVPPMVDLQLAADGSNAWGLGFSLDLLEATDLFWFDLVAETGRVVVQSAGTVGLASFSATVPRAGEAPYAWVVLDDGSGLDLRRVHPTGLEASTTFAFPPDESDAKVTSSIRTNALCVATYDPVAGETVMRRVLPDGTVHELARVSVNSQTVAIAASYEPDDMCWVHVDDGTEQILGWLDDGNTGNGPDRQLGADLPGFDGTVSSFVPVSADEIWLEIDPPEGGSRTVRLRFTTSSTARVLGDFRGPRTMRPLNMGVSY